MEVDSELGYALYINTCVKLLIERQATNRQLWDKYFQVLPSILKELNERLVITTDNQTHFKDRHDDPLSQVM